MSIPELLDPRDPPVSAPEPTTRPRGPAVFLRDLYLVAFAVLRGACILMAILLILLLMGAALQVGCAHLAVHTARICAEGGLTYRKGGCV